MPWAPAMRAATGVASPFPSAAPGAGAAGASAAAEPFSLSTAGVGVPAAPTAIRQSTVPTGTVSSGPTRISARVPLTGEGTSVSTLSVDTSTTPSSSSTESPTFLSHSSTVPSVTDSPISGKGRSTISEVLSSASGFSTVPPGSAMCWASVAAASACVAPPSSETLASCSVPAGADPLPPPPAPVPPTSISAKGVPTGTVSSGPTRILVSTPVAGEGTSVSTLSVEISTRPSSASTWSPSCLSQSRTVPSVTDSPISGIRS